MQCIVNNLMNIKVNFIPFRLRWRCSTTSFMKYGLLTVALKRKSGFVIVADELRCTFELKLQNPFFRFNVHLIPKTAEE